jgi:triacylglycerol lipase
LAVLTAAEAQDDVVLLHGLARSASSMKKLARHLESEGFRVHNIDYPSTKFTIEELAEKIRDELREKLDTAETVHVVTHSMGGILVRQIQKTNPIEHLGRVVMLSPPNQGSEVVDSLGGIKAFELLNGPAGQELGTGDGSKPNRLGKVDFELGVITGDRSINLILSMIIPGDDDGKVSVERAQVEGMKAFRVVHTSHPMIMKNRAVIDMVTRFLEKGSFD